MWEDKFDSSFIFEETLAIRCETEEDARALFDILDRSGCVWNNGDKLTEDDTLWGEYNENTCYTVMSNGRVTYGTTSNPRPISCKTCTFYQSEITEFQNVSHRDIVNFLF